MQSGEPTIVDLYNNLADPTVDPIVKESVESSAEDSLKVANEESANDVAPVDEDTGNDAVQSEASVEQDASVEAPADAATKSLENPGDSDDDESVSLPKTEDVLVDKSSVSLNDSREEATAETSENSPDPYYAQPDDMYGDMYEEDNMPTLRMSDDDDEEDLFSSPKKNTDTSQANDEVPEQNTSIELPSHNRSGENEGTELRKSVPVTVDDSLVSSSQSDAAHLEGIVKIHEHSFNVLFIVCFSTSR